MKALIAEDDLTSRRILAAVLKKTGYEPIEAADGLEAWEMLQNSDAPRLVLLDWVMPGMDGLEVLRRVRALPTDRPPYILMLTGKIEKAEIVTALNAGADDYLIKPFDPEELQARIEVGCRTLKLQAELSEKITELQRVLSEIKTLRGMVPICAHCKKIRDDQGFWRQVEVYVRDHTEAEFTHSLCPECVKQLYPDLAEPDDDAHSP